MISKMYTALFAMIQEGATPLMSATLSGLSAIVDVLINAGADVNKQTKVTKVQCSAVQLSER